MPVVLEPVRSSASPTQLISDLHAAVADLRGTSSGTAIRRLLLLLSLLALGGVVFWGVEWLPLRVAIQSIKDGVQLLLQMSAADEVAVGRCGGGEAARNPHPLRR